MYCHEMYLHVAKVFLNNFYRKASRMKQKKDL